MIVALHGFLGLPSDWSRLPFTTDFVPINLWDDLRALTPKDDDDAFTAWAENFLDSIRVMKEKPVLLGYSLGGRLALHALLRAPEVFAAGIIVSAHPGLQDSQARQERRAHDERWSQRFLDDPWEQVLRDWNAQRTLMSPPPELARAAIPLSRKEEDFDRVLLARALRSWSLARQADLRSEIRKCPIPLTFLSGSLDAKFSELNAGLKLTDTQRQIVIPNAGHRVPWDRPSAFVANLRTAHLPAPTV